MRRNPIQLCLLESRPLRVLKTEVEKASGAEAWVRWVEHNDFCLVKIHGIHLYAMCAELCSRDWLSYCANTEPRSLARHNSLTHMFSLQISTVSINFEEKRILSKAIIFHFSRYCVPMSSDIMELAC
jgi:hypothetical protein